jgi:hypothetical protein
LMIEVVAHETSTLSLTLPDGSRLPVNTQCALFYISHTWSHDSTATSVDIEQVFSKGRLILSHVQNRLSVQSTHTLLCLGAWAKLGLVKDKDVMQAARLPEVVGCEDELDSKWDCVL